MKSNKDINEKTLGLILFGIKPEGLKQFLHNYGMDFAFKEVIASFGQFKNEGNLTSDLKYCAELLNERGVTLSITIEPLWKAVSKEPFISPNKEFEMTLATIQELGIRGVTLLESTWGRYQTMINQDIKWGILGNGIFGMHQYKDKLATVVEDYGAGKADIFVVPPDLNRDWKVLKHIRQAFPGKIGIIVNEGCIFHCPFWSVRFNSAVCGQVGTCILYCKDRIKNEPWHKYASPWIRPQDLCIYKNLGISNFYLLADLTNPKRIRRNVQKYLDESYDGPIEDLLDLNSPVAQAQGNKIFCHTLDRFLQGTQCYGHDCISCGYCSTYMRTALVDYKS
jgi:hypothetical protein